MDEEKDSANDDQKGALDKAKGEKIVKILCFGDSLTEGYSPGYDWSPYSKPLLEIINKEHPGLACTIITAGERGELALEMEERLQLVLRSHGGNDNGNTSDMNKQGQKTSQVHYRTPKMKIKTKIKIKTAMKITIMIQIKMKMKMMYHRN